MILQKDMSDQVKIIYQFFIILKTDYFQLWFLYKSDAAVKHQELSELNTYKIETTRSAR